MASETLHRFTKNKIAVASFLVLSLVTLVALFGPFIAPYDPLEQDLANNYREPSREQLRLVLRVVPRMAECPAPIGSICSAG